MKQIIATHHDNSPDTITPAGDDPAYLPRPVRCRALSELPDRIFIIGFSGVGKTTEGEIIAERFGRNFFDLDDAITRSTGKTIPQIFEEEGEGRFRAIETQLLHKLSTTASNAVIACGGGTVCARVNRRILKESGLSILLVADVQTIHKRTRSSDRPLLGGRDPLQKIQELIRNRCALYLECADWIFSTSDALPDEVGENIYHYYLERYRQTGML